MVRRFVAASAVASIGIAVGAAVLLLAAPAVNLYAVTAVWCFVPLAWGIWAMLAPVTWVPQRLPLWGALLGLAAAVVAVFVLRLPQMVLGRDLPMLRWVALAVAPLLYYGLWFLVAALYRSITAGREDAG
jgi:hypothetical protein